MKMILLGAPGAGKGTQAERLCKVLNIPTISTGNILRAAVKNGTPTGKQAEAYMKAGKLVPDEVIIGIIHDRLDEDDCTHGIEIPDEAIMERMSGRRVCEHCGASYHLVAVPPKVPGVCDSCGGKLIQRHDDEPETVKHRLEVYHKETEPLKDFYAERGLLRSVENQPSVEATTKAILNALRR